MTTLDRIAKMDKVMEIPDIHNLAEKCFPIFVKAFEKMVKAAGQTLAGYSDEELWNKFNCFLFVVERHIRYGVSIREIIEVYDEPAIALKKSFKYLTKNLSEGEIILYLD